MTDAYGKLACCHPRVLRVFHNNNKNKMIIMFVLRVKVQYTITIRFSQWLVIIMFVLWVKVQYTVIIRFSQWLELVGEGLIS